MSHYALEVKIYSLIDHQETCSSTQGGETTRTIDIEQKIKFFDDGYAQTGGDSMEHKAHNYTTGEKALAHIPLSKGIIGQDQQIISKKKKMEDLSLLTCTPNYIYNPMLLYSISLVPFVQPMVFLLLIHNSMMLKPRNKPNLKTKI